MLLLRGMYFSTLDLKLLKRVIALQKKTKEQKSIRTMEKHT